MNHAEQEFLASWATGRVHHAWLICGPQGIGKGTLAERIARAVLSGTGDLNLPESHPVARRMAAGSHADFLLIQPEYDEAKEEFKDEIGVDAARELPEFMAKTPGEGSWRVVIINSVDQLNTAAANAILKALEEPPAHALLLLVSHQPSRLLPTIRSRCRMLRVAPPSPEAFARALPEEISREEVLALGVLSGYRPGVARAMHEAEAVELYAALCSALAAPITDYTAVAERLLSKTAPHARWRLLAEATGTLVARTVRAGLGETLEPVVEGEGQAIRALLSARPVAFWAAQHARLLAQFSLAARAHLDYKTVLMALLASIATDDLPLSA